MNLERAGWIGLTAIFVITGTVLFVEGYDGYGLVSLAIALAASVNLLPRKLD